MKVEAILMAYFEFHSVLLVLNCLLGLKSMNLL